MRDRSGQARPVGGRTLGGAAHAPGGLREGTQRYKQRDVEQDRQRVQGPAQALTVAELVGDGHERSERHVVVPVDDRGARGHRVGGQRQQRENQQAREVQDPGERQGAREPPHRRGGGRHHGNLRRRRGVRVLLARQERTRLFRATIDERQCLSDGQARTAHPPGALGGVGRGLGTPRGGTGVPATPEQPPQRAHDRADGGIKTQIKPPVNRRVHVTPPLEGNITGVIGQCCGRAPSSTHNGHIVRKRLGIRWKLLVRIARCNGAWRRGHSPRVIPNRLTAARRARPAPRG